MVPKGADFFRASAVVVSPKEHAGERIEGMPTSFMVPICAIPEKRDKDGNVVRKTVSLEENVYEFQNFFKWFGILPPPVDGQTDPDGSRAWAYYDAAMRSLVDPKRAGGPIYVSFSTRGWTPPVSAAKPKPEEMVFETWHGLAAPDSVARLNGQYQPGAGVQDRTGPPVGLAPAAPPAQPAPFTEPPIGAVQYPPPLPNGPTNADIHAEADLADEVEGLVEVAMSDPEQATEDSRQACSRLEELAWAAGWTEEQTAEAADWAALGDMAINPPDDVAAPADQPKTVPMIGDKWKFAKRDKDGAKIKNSKTGEPFPPQEVEVATVDEANKTCTVKSARDGKPVTDVRSKKPVVVKWEWLEL